MKELLRKDNMFLFLHPQRRRRGHAVVVIGRGWLCLSIPDNYLAIMCFAAIRCLIKWSIVNLASRTVGMKWLMTKDVCWQEQMAFVNRELNCIKRIAEMCCWQDAELRMSFEVWLSKKSMEGSHWNIFESGREGWLWLHQKESFIFSKSVYLIYF